MTLSITLVATGTPQLALNSDDGVVNSIAAFGVYSKTLQAYYIFADFNGHGVVDMTTRAWYGRCSGQPCRLGGVILNSKTRALCAVAFLSIAGIGRAALIVNIQSVIDAAGTTGDALDVTLTNTYPTSSVTVFGYGFGLSAGTPMVFTGLSFTSVTTGTTLAPFIFAGKSQFGPVLSGLNDEVSGFVGSTIAPGTTVGLGHVTFNLSPDAPAGTIPLIILSDFDSLLGLNEIQIPFSTGTGTVTVTSATPEPATSVLVGLTLTGLLGAVHHFRRRREIR